MSTLPINIYFEQTPNPESLKFVTNRVLLPNIVFESRKEENNHQSPLADSLYEKFDWISGVFIANNFITISKNSKDDWYELMNEVKEYLKMYFDHELEVFKKDFLISQMQTTSQETAQDDSIEARIQDLLTKYVKPAVENDGGFIAFKSYHEGRVTLEMQGSCSGCPSSQITLKSGIEGLLKRMIPEVQEVVAEAG
jgi:Fe-S cluster biogenesis protein NfuA